MRIAEDIKREVRRMMDREMELFRESVASGDADASSSPVVYTALELLLKKIGKMPPVWHPSGEKPREGSTFYILDEEGEIYRVEDYDSSHWEGYDHDSRRHVEGWTAFVLLSRVRKWAYRDDLI